MKIFIAFLLSLMILACDEDEENSLNINNHEEYLIFKRGSAENWVIETEREYNSGTFTEVKKNLIIYFERQSDENGINMRLDGELVSNIFTFSEWNSQGEWLTFKNNDSLVFSMHLLKYDSNDGSKIEKFINYNGLMKVIHENEFHLLITEKKQVGDNDSIKVIFSRF